MTIRKIENSKNWKFGKLKIRKGWKIKNWRWKGNLRRGLNFFVEFFQNHFFMSGPSRIYASLFYLLMYFDVCQNEILIKCHAVRNKLERQYSNSDEYVISGQIFTSEPIWPSKLATEHEPWKTETFTIVVLHNSLLLLYFHRSQVAKNPTFMRFCCFWSY